MNHPYNLTEGLDHTAPCLFRFPLFYKVFILFSFLSHCRTDVLLLVCLLHVSDGIQLRLQLSAAHVQTNIHYGGVFSCFMKCKINFTSGIMCHQPRQCSVSCINEMN